MHAVLLLALLAASFLAISPSVSLTGRSSRSSFLSINANSPEKLEAATANQSFFAQRAYPFGAVPDNAMARAMAQRLAIEQRYQTRSENDSQQAPPPTWAALGPLTVNTPEGAASGRVTTIVVDPRSPETLYIGASGGGVWRSTDGGGSWQSLSDNELTLMSGSLALDERTGMLWYGTGDMSTGGLHGDGLYGSGILRSPDGGNTWVNASGWNAETSQPPFGARGTTARIVIGSGEPRAVFAARTNGLWRTTDGGASWVGVVGGNITDVLLDPSNNSRIHIAVGRNVGSTSNGVWRSNDGGVNWERSSTLPSGTSVGRISLAMAPSNSSVLYASIARSSDQQLHGVYRSNDAGASWSRLPAPASLFDSGGNGHGFFDNVVAVDPRDANVVYLGGVELWKTVDGGNTWQVLSLAGERRVIHEDQFAIAFKPGNPDTVYVGNDGGVYKSTDAGATWTSLNNSLPITQFNSIAVHPENPGILLGGTQDQGLVRLNGGVWEQLVRGDAGASLYDASNPNLIVATKQRIRPIRSLNAGVTFLNINSGIDSSDRVAFYPPLASPGGNSAVLYFGTQRVWHSQEGGTIWRPASSDLTNGGVITALAAVPSVGGLVYAGSSDGRVYSSNGPGFWRNGAGIPDRWITSIAVDPRDPLAAYLTVSGFGTGHVFKTTDAGNNWTDVSGSLPDAPASAVVVDPRGPVYVATDVGVFRSEDNSTWTSYNTGLPNAYVTALALDARSGTLFAATYGRGVFHIALRAPRSGPSILSGGVVNGAGYQRVLAPGTMATLFGSRLAVATVSGAGSPLPTTLNGTSVTVSGRAAPLFFVAPGQINFLVPFEIGGTQAVITVSTAEGSASVAVPLVASAPGLFDGIVLHGNGAGAVDAANPAAPGEVLVVFATGLGLTNPLVPSGVTSPSNPPAAATVSVSATLNGRAATVFFAGLAPGFVGLYQINFQVPDGVSGSVPLLVTAGGRASNAVTVVVR